MTKLLFSSGNQNRFPQTGITRKGLILLIVSLISLSTFAQQTTIKGTILDEKSKLSVIGATIKIKGQPGGAITDVNGNYSLKVKSLPATLLITIVGYKYQEVDVYDAEPITIYLNEDFNKLNTVVVVGYGTQKREELTGAIASIPIGQLKEVSQTSFVSGLQGLASGVQVTQTSGAPGGAASVRIRGGNSITGGNEPLYVIDGFPIYNDNSAANAGALNGGLGSAGTSINPLSFLSPNDIESIDILKDASATAIYGSRGANGVIIITTRKGKHGSSKVSYDASFGFQNISNKIDLLNAQQWAQYKNDARASVGKAAQFSASDIEAFANNNTDWQSAILRTAPVQSHQITVAGGNEKTKYAISAGYLSQDGIIINSGFDRYNGRVNIESKVNDKLNVGVNFIETYSTSKAVPDGVITSSLFMPPTAPIYDANGAYTFKSPYESVVANPVATLNLATNQSNTNRLLTSGFGEYEIIKDLKAKVLIGADLIYNKQNSYIPQSLYEGYTYGGLAAVGSRVTQNLLNENTISYTKSFDNKHNIELLGGLTQQQSVSENVIARTQNYANDETEYNDLNGGSSPQKPSSSYQKWALLSYLGRATYNYKQKYFATASFRADGSSRLGINNRWGYFPSASVAWQANKESFVKEFSDDIKLSNLKVRLSAGQTGNQEIPVYKSRSLLSGYAYPTNGTATITGYAPSQLGNEDLKWETTAQYDAGIDLGFFKDRISLSVDAYYKKTSDLLLNVPTATSTGYSSVLKNIGSVENKGFEITLNTQNIKTKNFNWSTDITYSVNRNKVLSLSEGITTLLVSSELQTGSAIVVGQPLGTFWGYKTDGLYRNASEIPSSPLLSNTKIGDVKYVDVDGKNGITQAGDMTVIGNAQPKFIAGITNNFSYRNFDLSVFVQGSYGNKVYSYIFQQLMVPTGYQNVIAGFNDHYTSTNATAKYQRANETTTTNPVSDLYVYDASYLKVKSLTLGYSLPKKLVSKLKIDKLRFYLSANNLLTLTKYKGYDPEVNYYDANSSRQGVDVGGYPSAKTYTAGLNLTF